MPLGWGQGTKESKERVENSPDVSSFLDGLVEGSDNILFGEVELAVFVHPSIQVLAEGKSGNRHVVAVDQILLQEEVEDL